MFIEHTNFSIECRTSLEEIKNTEFTVNYTINKGGDF